MADVLLGENGFLAKEIREIAPEEVEDLIVLGSRQFDLLNDIPPQIGKDIDTIIDTADYYPGLEATNANPQTVYSHNVAMYEKVFALAALNKAKAVVTIGTTACYPVVDVPLTEDMFNGDPAKLNPKLLAYALSRFTLLDIAALYRERYGIDHKHLVLPNFYGPGDKYERGRSHLLASWVRDFWQAKENESDQVDLWGPPNQRREFIYIRDAARYVLRLASIDLHREVLNVGTGETPTYEELANAILRAIDYADEDRLRWDQKVKPRRMQEIMDLSELEAYKKHLPDATPLSEGLDRTVSDFKQRVLKWT